MKLLLAEDDLMLGQATCKGLQLEGHTVDWVTSGDRVAVALKTHRYDCVLLDLGLPEVSGEACLEVLRRAKDPTPVIVITARGHKDDRIAVLDIGADDYLVKPFDLDEVAARVRAVVRRSQAREGEAVSAELVHGPLKLISSTRTALWNGNVVPLKNKEFWVLETLMRLRNRIVSRQHLEETMYGWTDDLSSNTIEVYIHHLRRKLGSAVIVTVRGIGYQLATEAELQALLARPESPDAAPGSPAEPVA